MTTEKGRASASLSLTMRVAFYPESGTLACHTIEHIATHTGHHRRFRCAASLLWALLYVLGLYLVAYVMYRRKWFVKF